MEAEKTKCTDAISQLKILNEVTIPHKDEAYSKLDEDWKRAIHERNELRQHQDELRATIEGEIESKAKLLDAAKSKDEETVSNLQKRVKMLEAQQSQDKTRSVKAAEDLKQKTQALTEANNEMAVLNREKADLNKKLNDLTGEFEKAKNSPTVVQVPQHADVAPLQLKIKQLEESLHLEKEQAKDMKKINTTLTANFKDMEKNEGDRAKEIEEIRKNDSELKKHVEDADNKLNASIQAKTKAEDLLKEVQAQLAEKTKYSDSMTKQIELMKSQHAESLRNLQEGQDGSGARLQSLEADNQELKEKFDGAVAEHSGTLERLDLATSEREKLDAEILDLKSQVSEANRAEALATERSNNEIQRLTEKVAMLQSETDTFQARRSGPSLTGGSGVANLEIERLERLCQEQRDYRQKLEAECEEAKIKSRAAEKKSQVAENDVLRLEKAKKQIEVDAAESADRLREHSELVGKVSTVKHLTTENERLKGEVKDLKTKQEQLKAGESQTLATAKKQADHFKKAFQEAESKAKAAETAKTAAEEGQKTTSEMINTLKERMAATRNAIGNANREAKTAKDSEQTAQQKLRDTEMKLKTANDELAKAKAAPAAEKAPAGASVESLEQKIQQLQNANAQLRKKAQAGAQAGPSDPDAAKKIADLEKAVDAANSTAAQQKAEADQHKAEADKFKQEADKAKNDVAIAQSKLVPLEQKIKEWEPVVDAIPGLQKELAEQEQQIAEAEKAASAIEGDAGVRKVISMIQEVSRICDDHVAKVAKSPDGGAGGRKRPPQESGDSESGPSKSLKTENPFAKQP